MKNEIQKEVTKDTVTNEPIICISCKKSNPELQLNESDWICEDCAQIISSHATDMGY